uniref:TFIIIC_delta domain-containing protein n=1 Tax=Globodera pallida TaxID=36090 RepID=A0A183BLZ4_GLOPA
MAQNNSSGTSSSTPVRVYSASKFRIDINILTRDGPLQSGKYEILMEINTTDGRKRTVIFDAKSLTFLHDQLDALARAFPRCLMQTRVRGHSTPIDLPRLGLASLSFTIPSLHNGSDQTLCFSGHGSFIEIYSNFKHSWQLVEALDAFPETKCTVNGLFPFRLNERECLLLCFGQNEFAFFTATQFKDDQMGGILEESRWNWKRVKGGSLSDWILNAKILFGDDENEEGSCLKAGTKVVLHFANNWIRMLELFGDRTDETAAKPFEVLSLRLGCQALVTSSFLHGHHWTSLRVFACTSFGAIHLFQPAIGPQILRTFFGNVVRNVFRHSFRFQSLVAFFYWRRPLTSNLECSKWCKTSCVEMKGLFLERKVDICWATGGGGTIRSILALECDRQVPKGSFDLLVGSERGSLFAVSLSADLQPLSFPIKAKKVNAFAFIRIRGILCLISLDKKSRTDVNASEEPDLAEHFRVNFSDCNVGNRFFCSTHRIIGAPIDQFLWVQPESCQLFLTIDQNGQVTVYRIGESSDENDSHRSLLTVSQFLLSNNKCGNEDENKVAKVQVALLIAETSADVPTVGVLLLGTRSGTLMAFSLQSGQLLLLNRLAHGTNGCAKTGI